MTPECFDCLHRLVGPHIQKKTTRLRQPISSKERLALTLRYLATGDSQQTISFSFRIGRTTVCNIIYETCLTIWEVLSKIYLRPPTSSVDWKNIAGEFSKLWNFPHCLGAIDGKHIGIECPINSGSLYFNYKGFFSLVLLAVCDAHYVFTLVNIGEYGSNNDSGILLNSTMGQKLENNSLALPQPEPLNGCHPHLPYYMLGDDIFALKTWLMRPFPGRNVPEAQRIFNYRLSRARRVIENAFGILRARWRIFSRPIKASVETAEAITKAAVCLHNFLRLTQCAGYCPTGFVDSELDNGVIKPGEWRSQVARDSNAGGAVININPLRGRRNLQSAIEVREALMKYFLSNNGSLPWQWDYVRNKGN